MTAHPTPPSSSRLQRLLVDRGGALFLATLLLYLWLAPPWFVAGDNAEFCALGGTGGVPHPSGFPVYLLWLRAMSWLPTSAAHAAALATAVLGAAQVLVLHAAARAWGARVLAASLAVALAVTAPLLLRLNTAAEVMAMTGLVAAAILWVAAPVGPLRGRRRVIALGLLGGLGLGTNLVIVAVAPVGLWGAMRGLGEVPGRRAPTVGLGISALALGLTPYLCLCAQPASEASWGAIASLGDLLHHFLRRDFGSFAMTNSTAPVDRLGNLREVGALLGRGWWWLPGIAGLIAAGRRSAGGPHAWGWRWLLVSIVLAGPVLAMLSNAPMTGHGRFNGAKIFALATLLLAVPVAVALDDVGTWLGAERGLAAPGTGLATLLVVLLAAGSTAVSLPWLGRVNGPAVDHAVRNLMRSLPQGAIVLTEGDYYLFGTAYLQDVEHLRQDLVVVDVGMIDRRWYRERTAHHAGFDLFPHAEATRIDAMGTTVLAHERPLFVNMGYGSVLPGNPRYPTAMLVRVLPQGEVPPPARTIAAENQAMFESFQLDYEYPRASDDTNADVHDLYGGSWAIVADMLSRAGEPADDARAMAAFLAPR